MKVSLWLIPPQKIYTQLEKEIQELAKIDKTPTFIPHITIASGYVDVTKLPHIIENLNEFFSSFGAIPCIFHKDLGIVEGFYHDKQEYQWNQSTVAILKREKKFMQSIFLARKILFNDKDFETRMEMSNFDNHDLQDIFRPPTNEPHSSFAYSTKPLGRFVKYYPDDFESTELALFETDPGSLDGVNKWREIARIKWSP